MTNPRRYSPEVRERAVRMVLEHGSEYSSQWEAMVLEHGSEYGSQWEAMVSIAAKIGCTPATLLKSDR